MSETPQQAGPRTPEIDMVSEIAGRAIPQNSGPPERGPSSPEDPNGPENVSRETSEAGADKPSSPPSTKNKRSSVYVYLAILFGAAFLMLLLAYFVQQRNNATVLNDLLSTTASREELLESIQQLEEKNQALQKQNQKLEENLEEERTRSAELEQTSDLHREDYLRLLSWYDQSNTLSCLERCNDTGDYLLMGVMIQGADVIFNRDHPDFSNQYLIPAQETQYLDLRKELFEKSGLMVMERRTEADGSESAEFPMVADGAVRDGVFDTAVELYAIVRNYATDPEYAAGLIANEFPANSGNMEILNSRAFKPATVEWFKEIKADLIARGYLRENADGTMGS